MKLNLKEKIKAIIDAYKTNMTTQHEDIKQMLEPYKEKGHRYTVNGLKQEIGEQMEKIMSNWKKYDMTLNQQVKEIIATAKIDVLKAIGMTDKKQKSNDYATKISNAIQFMKMTLDDVDADAVDNAAATLDVEIYAILKDFVDDYDTMKQFKKMVEKKVPTFNGYDGSCIMPMTFGKMCKVESIINALGELETAAENLFIYKRTDSQEVIRIQGLAYALPMDGYAEENAEQMIVDVAVILDALADEIDSEGQSETSGSGQKIDDPSK